MEPQEVTIGIIVKPHGLRGMLKVRPTTDDPQRYRRLDRVKVYLRGEILGEFQVQRAEITDPQMVLVKFAEHYSCDAVEAFRGA